MPEFNRSEHWENIYKTKTHPEMSWYQAKPTVSLDFINELGIRSSAKIIDAGGGESLLAEHLLALGFTDITVLDISGTAIEHAKQRLGKNAQKITWVNADILSFKPLKKYDLWHDRALFHFLTEAKDIRAYVDLAEQNITEGGVMMIGTFSEDGPKKCSGINTRRYSESSITEAFAAGFKKINCKTMNHHTPFGASQNFIFCSFRKI